MTLELSSRGLRPRRRVLRWVLSFRENSDAFRLCEFSRGAGGSLLWAVGCAVATGAAIGIGTTETWLNGVGCLVGLKAGYPSGEKTSGREKDRQAERSKRGWK